MTGLDRTMSIWMRKFGSLEDLDQIIKKTLNHAEILPYNYKQYLDLP
jgi:hypothetical protein